MDLFKINELRQYQFIQLPKELLYNPRYKGLSSDSKILYGLLLDRMELSRENNWINEKGEIYLIFTRQNIQALLNISDKPCTKAFKQLSQMELIKEQRQGLGKPNLIFIGHIVYDTPQSIENPMNRKMSDSVIGKYTTKQSANVRPNKTEFIKTENLEEEESINKMDVDQEVINIYKDCISNNISNREVETLKELQGTVGKELLNKAIVLATMKNGKNLGYIQAVLDDWEEKGLTTLDQVNTYLANWLIKNKKANENRTKQINKRAENKDYNYSKKKGNFNDYEQRTYDFGKLEKQLLGW
jgi:DnaD/phage-associated family protein